MNSFQIPILATVLLLSLLPAPGADLNTAVEKLIPGLAAENTEERYAPQIELQSLAANSARPGAEAERMELAAILAQHAADSRVPQPARVWMVRQLEYVGAEESVPSLSSLLNAHDPELQECARRALEKNPSPKAITALREALNNKPSDPRWTAGLIHALGERRDAASTGLISQTLQHPALSTASAAALARIATPDAIHQLQEASKKDPAFNQPLLAAADQLLADGKPNEARDLYRQLNSPEHSPAIRAGVLAGLVQCNPDGASQLIGNALQNDEPRLQHAAILAATSLNDEKLITRLATLLPKLTPAAQIQLLAILNRSGEPAALKAATSENESVRIAALQSLGRIGGTSSIPTLIHSAQSDSKPEQDAARTSLASLPGQESVATLKTIAAKGETPGARNSAINALAARGETSTLPDLVAYSSDPTVSQAALNALKKLGSDKELPALARLLATTKSADALAALKSVAGRVQDRPAAATSILTEMNTSDPEATRGLLETLSILGGADALIATTKLAASPDPELRDASIRALSAWRDYAATPVLLRIAADPESLSTHNILALRGIVRLIKETSDQPPAERLALTTAAMAAARRDDERKLVLSALGSIPHPEAASAIKKLLADETLKTEAGLAGLALSEALLPANRDAAQDLARAVKDADLSSEINRRANRILR